MQQLALFETQSISKNTLDTAELATINAHTANQNAKEQEKIIASDVLSLQHQISALDAQIAAANEKSTLMNKGLDTPDQTIARAQAEAAALDLDQLALIVDKHTIRNQVPGIVESINFAVGEFIGAGAPFATLVDPNQQTLTLYVREADLSQISRGDVLTFSLASDPNKTIKGTITYIAPQAMFTPMNVVIAKDRDRLVFEVTLNLEANVNFKPGMLLMTKLGA